MLAAQLTLIVIGPSVAVPDDGDTMTHESDELTFQSLFAVKEIVPELPSALSSILEGLVIASSGAF